MAKYYLDALREEKENLGISWEEYCNLKGMKENALEKWRRGRNRPGREYREKILSMFPEVVFDKEAIESALFQSFSSEDLKESLSGDTTNSVDRLELMVNREFIVRGICELSRLFQWFLFKTNPEERNALREYLGDSWTEFRNLTRAMAGETAFKLVQSETDLSKNKKGC